MGLTGVLHSYFFFIDIAIAFLGETAIAIPPTFTFLIFLAIALLNVLAIALCNIVFL